MPQQSRTAVIRVEMADTSASPAPRKRRSFKSPRISAFAPVIAKPVIKVKVTTPTTTALIIEAEKKKQRKFRERMSPLKTGSSMVKAPPRRSERKARRSGTPKTRFAKRRDYTAACKRASTPTAMCSEMRSLRRVPLKKRHRSLQRTQTDPKLHSVLNGDALLRQDSSKTASLLSTVIDDVADAHSSAGGRTAAGRRRKRSSKKRLRHSLPPASPRMEACKSAPFPVTLPLSKSASTPMCDSPSIEKITSDTLQKKSAKDDFFGSFDLELQRSETFEDNCLGDLVATSSLTATTRGSVERGRVRGQRPESSRVFRERDESLHSDGSVVVGAGMDVDGSSHSLSAASSVGSGGTVRSVRTLSSGSRSRSPVLAETIDSMIESTLGARNRSRSGERVPAADSLTPAGSERSRTESVESGMSESDDFGTVIAPPSDFRGRSAERRRRSSSQKRSLSPANILFSDPSMDAVAIASGGARLGHRLSLTCPELRGVPLPPPKVCDDVSQPSATGRITSDSETSRRRSFRIREESRSPSRTRTRTASPRRLSALFGRADAGQWTASEMSAQSRELKRQNMALIVDLALRTVASVRVDNAESWVLRWKLSHWHWEPPPTAAPTEDARSNLQTLFGANRRQSFVESVDQLAAELSHPSAEVSKSKSKSAHTEEIEEGDDGDSDCVSTSVSTEDSDYKSDSRRKERRKVAGDFSELSESEVFERERECLESAERFKVAVKYAQMRVCFYEGFAAAQQQFAESMASVCDAYSEGCSELSNDPRISDAVKLQMDEDLNVGDDYVELATGRRLAAIHNQLGECLAEACAKLRSTLLRSPLIATISRLDATKKQLQQCFDKTVQLKHYCKRLLRNVFAKSSDKFVSRLRKRIVKRRLPRGIGKHKAATYLISETPAKIKRLTTAVQRSVALQSVWKYLQCARRCNELRRRYYGQLVCRGLRHLSTGVLAAVNSVNEHRQGVGRVVEYWSAPGAAVPECELTPTIAELGFGQRPPHELDVEFMDDWRVLRAPVLYNEMDARPSEIHAVNECLWRDAFEMRCVAYGSEMMDDLMRKKPAKPQPSVGEVLGDTSLRNHFMKYLTQRCASENLSFLEAVALLRLATDQSVAKCLAQKIFSEFVVSGAPQMVNLSAHRRAHAVELMAKLRAEVCSDELRAAYKRQSLAILRKDYALRLSRVSAMPTLATHSSFEGADCSRPMPVASALRVDATTRVRSHSAQVPATGRRPPRHKYTTTPVVCMDDGHLLTRGRQSSLSSLSTDSSSQRSAPRLLREADAHWDVATMFDHCFEEVASWMSSSIIPEFVHSAVFDAFLNEVLSKGKEAHSDEDSESALLKADSGLGAILQLKAARSLTQLFGRGKSKSPPSGSPSAVRRTGLFSAMRSRSKSREAKAVPQSVVGTGSAERGDRQLVAEEKASQIGDLPPVLSIAEATRRKKKKTHSLSLWKEDEKRRAKKTQGAKRKPDSGKRRKQAVAAVPTAARSKRKRTSLKKASEKRKRPKYKKRT